MSLLLFCIRNATEIHTPRLFPVCRDHFMNLCSQNLRTLKLLRGLSLCNHWYHYDIAALVARDLPCLLVTGFLIPVLRCLKDQRPRSGLGGNLVQSSCYLLSSLWRFSWYTELALPNETRWVWSAPLTYDAHNIPEVTLCPFTLTIVVAGVMVATRTLARRSTLNEF